MAVVEKAPVVKAFAPPPLDDPMLVLGNVMAPFVIVPEGMNCGSWLVLLRAFFSLLEPVAPNAVESPPNQPFVSLEALDSFIAETRPVLSGRLNVVVPSPVP